MMKNKKLSRDLQAHSDAVIEDLLQDLAIERDIEYPTIIVYDGTLLPGDDDDSWAIYDPAENQIAITYDKTAKSYEEYPRFAKSRVIGSIDSCNPVERTEYLLLHELAHWMTEAVLKNYSHKHNISFRLCYAYLRLKWKTYAM